VYQWHTFYGSGSSDYARGIALDAAGGLYVAGTSLDTWNGPAGQAALHSFGGSADLFVLKLGSNGVYQWHTFYGDSDDGHAIALDKSGNIYVTGSSGYTWDGPSGQGPLHAHSADTFDIHVLKLNSSGAYQWHTFYEANNHSYKYGIAAGGANSVYVTGLSNAAWSGDGGAAPLHPFNGSSDTYILKLNTSGIYRWHTFYGSDDPIYGNNGIAVDGVGNVLTTGYTATSWNGDGDAPPLNAYGGGWDIFVLKMKDHPTYHADFDGDGKSDITVWRPDGGNWFTINSKTGTRSVTGFGTSGDVPVPGDYDGDGTADRAVFRPSGNTWFIRNSATGTDGVVSYGASGDSPVSGDYDGDGKTDVAVFRPTSNTWFIRNSATSTQSAVSYGTSGDVPVPGDYDGDGKTDVAVFRPASGTWFIVNSSNNSQRAVNFGASGDTPVPGDYDGDGRADAAVFRPANGIWFIQQSSTGMTSVVSWGTSTDVPIK
jgi:putative transposon-encoded protein